MITGSSPSNHYHCLKIQVLRLICSAWNLQPKRPERSYVHQIFFSRSQAQANMLRPDVVLNHSFNTYCEGLGQIRGRSRRVGWPGPFVWKALSGLRVLFLIRLVPAVLSTSELNWRPRRQRMSKKTTKHKRHDSSLSDRHGSSSDLGSLDGNLSNVRRLFALYYPSTTALHTTYHQIPWHWFREIFIGAQKTLSQNWYAHSDVADDHFLAICMNFVCKD